MVPLDGSAQAERALPFAVRVARETAGRLVLVRTPSGRDPLVTRSAATSVIAAVFSEVVGERLHINETFTRCWCGCHAVSVMLIA